MAKDSFQFRQFTVWQDRCAMKVGTDGVLIGAWAQGGKRILDIGTGTGLVAMMMAQRFGDAAIDTIDVDAVACGQAQENIDKAGLSDRIHVLHTPLQAHNGTYDAIVSNPPFFENSLKAPDDRRTMARHADSLPVADIFRCACRMLSDSGHFSAIIPSAMFERYEEEAAMQGFFLTRLCEVRTVERKQAKRFMVTYSKTPNETVEIEEHVLMAADGSRSEWYSRLTRDFYL